MCRTVRIFEARRHEGGSAHLWPRLLTFSSTKLAITKMSAMKKSKPAQTRFAIAIAMYLSQRDRLPSQGHSPLREMLKNRYEIKASVNTTSKCRVRVMLISSRCRTGWSFGSMGLARLAVGRK